ncbi:MAG: hypothetical protein WDM78_10135 [Puia sp.]
MNPLTGRTSSIGDHETDNGQYNVSGVTEWRTWLRDDGKKRND